MRGGPRPRRPRSPFNNRFQRGFLGTGAGEYPFHAWRVATGPQTARWAVGFGSAPLHFWPANFGGNGGGNAPAGGGGPAGSHTNGGPSGHAATGQDNGGPKGHEGMANNRGDDRLSTLDRDRGNGRIRTASRDNDNRDNGHRDHRHGHFVNGVWVWYGAPFASNDCSWLRHRAMPLAALIGGRATMSARTRA